MESVKVPPDELIVELVVLDELDVVTNNRGVRCNTKEDPKRPVTIIGAGFGARGCHLVVSRSVFLLLTMISSLWRSILNFKLLTIFSVGSVKFSLDDFVSPKLTGLQVPSLLARMITDTRASFAGWFCNCERFSFSSNCNGNREI